jgi:hypothetical protein
MGYVVQLLGHVFADALHLTSVVAGAGLGFVADLAPGQVRRQAQPLGLLLLLRGRRCSLLRQRVDLVGHGRQIGFDLVFEQAFLLGIESLGPVGELHALEQRVFVGELLHQGALVAQLGYQAGNHLAQLIGVQIFQRLRLSHHGRHCANTDVRAPSAHAPIGKCPPRRRVRPR